MYFPFVGSAGASRQSCGAAYGYMLFSGEAQAGSLLLYSRKVQSGSQASQIEHELSSVLPAIGWPQIRGHIGIVVVNIPSIYVLVVLRLERHLLSLPSAVMLLFWSVPHIGVYAGRTVTLGR